MRRSHDARTSTRLASAWVDAWRAWNRTKAFRFGPLTDSRAVSDIGFMVDTEKIDAVIDGSEAARCPAVHRGVASGAAGADVRGLAAVEHVLFQRDPTEPDPCSYAAAAAALVADETAARRTRRGPTGRAAIPPFADACRDPGNAKYADARPCSTTS